MLDLIREIASQNMVGKSPSTLDSGLYQKIMKYAIQNDLWMFRLHIELGLVPERVYGLDSEDRISWFITEFGYAGGNWDDIPNGHQQLLLRRASALGLNMDVLLSKHNVARRKWVQKYSSLEDVREDLRGKNLLQSSIQDIKIFDGNNTYSGIIKFARKHGYTMTEVWSAMDISYNEKLAVIDGRPKVVTVYPDDKALLQDFRSKKLLGKTIRGVQDYDASKTYSRVVKYAKRTERPINEIWALLRVTSSARKTTPRQFSTIQELKRIVKERGLTGIALKSFRLSDPVLFKEITHWQPKTSYSFEELWELLGIEARPTLRGTVAKIRRTGFRTAGELHRKDLKLYKTASRIAIKHEISIKELWRMAGLSGP